MDHLLNGPVISSCGDQYLLRASVISEGVNGFITKFYKGNNQYILHYMLFRFFNNYNTYLVMIAWLEWINIIESLPIYGIAVYLTLILPD